MEPKSQRDAMIVTTKHAWYDNPEGMTEPYHPFGVRNTSLPELQSFYPFGVVEQDQPETHTILHSTKPQFVTVQDI